MVALDVRPVRRNGVVMEREEASMDAISSRARDVVRPASARYSVLRVVVAGADLKFLNCLIRLDAQWHGLVKGSLV